MYLVYGVNYDLPFDSAVFTCYSDSSLAINMSEQHVKVVSCNRQFGKIKIEPRSEVIAH